MKGPGLVVVGAGLAGLRAVEAARRHGFDGAVTLLGAEPHAPYDRPPLSKQFLTEGGEARYLRTGASLLTDLRVEARLGAPATALDVHERVVVADGEQIGYSRLVIATGAAAREVPATPRLAGLHTLRTLEDALALRRALRPGSRVVIVGAGFVGSEVAFAAQRRGAEVTVLEAAAVPLVRAVGEVMGAACAGLLGRAGIDVRCGVAVESFTGTGTGTVEAVRLSDGSALPADVVVVGIGAAPATGWLHGSGLVLSDGVLCDERLNAGAPGVYAAGDVARWFNPLFGQSMRLEHWTAAAEQGALAGRNAADPAQAAVCAAVPYFWSDWGQDRIQFVGLPGADEVSVVVGDADGDDFLGLYRRGDRIIGALGLNQRQPMIRFRAMIAERASWAGALAYARTVRRQASCTQSTAAT